MVQTKKYLLTKHFDGLPKPTDFTVVQEELPPLKLGEFLTEAVYFSVDPYMRAFEPYLPLGTVMIGVQVAKIVESKNSIFPVGKYVVGGFGWQTRSISNGSSSVKTDLPVYVLPDFRELPLSLALGVLGMHGNTAYFGFLEICQPKEGETVVVSSAAGAVGSLVGQIAKIKGCKVVGIAGDDKKGEWLIEELGFDHFVNYKKPNFRKSLVAAAPKGIDCYFDNVGGEISSTVLQYMNTFGRISVCGAISGYNYKKLPKATTIQDSVVGNQLKMEGFVVTRWSGRWMEGIRQNLEWIKEGKLKYKETVTEGFDNIPKAFIDMLQGGNTGKAIVKA